MRHLGLLILALPFVACARADDQTAEQLARTGFAHQRKHEYDKAITAFSAALKKDPTLAEVRDTRGDAYLLTGQIAEAITDFDAFLKAKPKFTPGHWRRGIALYYAEKYADGVAQFETHKTVNPQDVENAAWHYLCNVHVVGKEKAKAALIDVTQDPRVPMAQIQKLFAGTMTVDDVLAAANKTDAKTPPGVEARCYAHLYVGLWYESEKNATKAKEHLTLAADTYPIEDYMGQIAKMHAKRLK